MASTSACRCDEYLHYAEECRKFVEDADDLETKAVFELTAEAWTMLAAQVKVLEAPHQSWEAATQPARLESAA
jgi:hypothetical protein